MSNIISKLRVSLGLDNSKFKSGLKDSEKQTKRFGETIGKIGGLIAGAFAIGKITSFFKNSFKLYGIQEDAERKLRAQIEANGKAANETLKDYKSFASELQGITTVGDEVTLKLLQVAESMGATTQQSKDAAKGAIGLSKAFGISLETAMRGVILANNGQYEMLQRYIPTLRTANSDTEKAAALQKAMADGMRIASAEAETASGRVTQLSNTWGDLQENIGRSISNTSTFKTILSELRSLLGKFSESAKKTGAQNIFESWGKQGKLTSDFIKKQIKSIGGQVDELNKSKLQILEENKWADIQLRFLGMETSGDKLNKQIEERLQLADLLNAKYKEIEKGGGGSTTPTEIRDIKTLSQKITDLKLDQETATGARLISINQEIEALKKELAVLKELKYVKGVDNFASTGISKPDEIQTSKRPGLVSLPNQKDIDLLKSQLSGLRVNLLLAVDEASKSAFKSQISALESKLIAEETGFEIPVKLTMEGTLANSEGFIAMQEKLNASMNETKGNALLTSGAFSDYGSVMGSVGDIAAMTGDKTTATWAGVASQVLSSIAQMIPALFSQSVGGAVAAGAALPFPANLAAIAAGVAGVVSAFSGIGGGSASASAPVTSIDTRGFKSPAIDGTTRRTADTQAQNINVEVTGTIKGKDIALANNQGQKQLKR